MTGRFPFGSNTKYSVNVSDRNSQNGAGHRTNDVIHDTLVFDEDVSSSYRGAYRVLIFN